MYFIQYGSIRCIHTSYVNVALFLCLSLRLSLISIFRVNCVYHIAISSLGSMIIQILCYRKIPFEFPYTGSSHSSHKRIRKGWTSTIARLARWIKGCIGKWHHVIDTILRRSNLKLAIWESRKRCTLLSVLRKVCKTLTLEWLAFKWIPNGIKVNAK